MEEVERKESKILSAALWIAALSIVCLCAVFWSDRVVDAALSDEEQVAVGSEEPSSSVSLLKASIGRLENAKSLSADVEICSHFFGEEYLGRGVYKELSTSRSFGGARRPFEKTRFLLHVMLTPTNVEEAVQNQGEEENFMTIVCDVASLAWWSHLGIDGGKTLKRIDLVNLWDKFQQLDEEELATLRSRGVSTLNCGLNSMPGLGGLAGTLRGAAAAFEYGPDVVMTEERGRKLYKIEGVAREGLYEKAKKTLGVEFLEDYILENFPTNATIYFDVQQLFPCRIEFYSLVGEGKNAKRNDVFRADYTPNDEPVRAEDFNFIQPQSVYTSAEGSYIEELVPGVRL